MNAILSQLNHRVSGEEWRQETKYSQSLAPIKCRRFRPTHQHTARQIRAGMQSLADDVGKNTHGVSGLTKKAEPPPTRDVNRDSGTDSANGGWLRRLVRPRLVITEKTPPMPDNRKCNCQSNLPPAKQRNNPMPNTRCCRKMTQTSDETISVVAIQSTEMPVITLAANQLGAMAQINKPPKGYHRQIKVRMANLDALVVLMLGVLACS